MIYLMHRLFSRTCQQIMFLQKVHLRVGVSSLTSQMANDVWDFILLSGKRLDDKNKMFIYDSFIRRGRCIHFQHAQRKFSVKPLFRETHGYEIYPEFSHLRAKILYNCLLDEANLKTNWLRKKVLSDKYFKRMSKEREKEIRQIPDIPVALKYLNEEQSNNDLNVVKPMDCIATDECVQMPYATFVDVNKPSTDFQEPLISDSLNANSNVKSVYKISAESNISYTECDFETEKLLITRNWMTDYEQYDDSELESIVNIERPWQMNYGTPDPNVPVSKISCGGCGALLHCQDASIPGYLPSELFIFRTDTELRSMQCQRCHFLVHYNMALNVNVSPSDYPHLLAHIKEKRALVVLMVDLMDFPCSMWPGIIDIIGTKRPVVVVGNKVDLLPQDCPGFLNHILNCLTTSIKQNGLSAANIKHTALISSKTGYGVEELITKLHNLWEYEGDVYLIGCTNVGKSTLFNALLQSDFCKVQAVDLVQRATTCQWPGTTLNLLKFPILRPAGWRLHLRVRRLMKEREGKHAEQRLRRHQLRTTGNADYAMLIGHIGRTFRLDTVSRDEEPDPFSVRISSRDRKFQQSIGIDPEDEIYRNSHWCYDTPGTVQPDQVLHLLTTEELMLAVPRSLLVPRTFLLKPAHTLLLAGLGRLDFLHGDTPCRLTVFASNKLPITVCHTEDAVELYQSLLGSELLAVPCGGPERLTRWPGLTAHSEILEVVGKSWKESAADIVLSSAGWVAVTPKENSLCQFQAWTPHGCGVYIRNPALLRFSVNHRGKKIRRSPAYTKGKYMYIKN